MESNLTQGEWDMIRTMINDNISIRLAIAILEQKIMLSELDMYRAHFMLTNCVEKGRTSNTNWSLSHTIRAELNKLAPWKQ